jgi:hypothetical protein
MPKVLASFESMAKQNVSYTLRQPHGAFAAFRSRENRSIDGTAGAKKSQSRSDPLNKLGHIKQLNESVFGLRGLNRGKTGDGCVPVIGFDLSRSYDIHQNRNTRRIAQLAQRLDGFRLAPPSMVIALTSCRDSQIAERTAGYPTADPAQIPRSVGGEPFVSQGVDQDIFESRRGRRW